MNSKKAKQLRKVVKDTVPEWDGSGYTLKRLNPKNPNTTVTLHPATQRAMYQHLKKGKGA